MHAVTLDRNNTTQWPRRFSTLKKNWARRFILINLKELLDHLLKAELIRIRPYP